MKIKNKSLQLLAVGVLLATSGAFAQSYTLLSQGQPASASGNEHTTTEALYVNDGNLSTRWASRHQNWEWIQIDLGSDQVVDRIVLDWEAAYASEYQVFVVPDGATSWGTPTYVNSNGQGGREELVQSFGTGRYVVIQGLERSWTNGNQYGISLFEFEVYQKSGKKVFWLGQFDAYPQVASAGDAFFHTGLQESFIYNNNTWEQFAIGAVGATGPQGEKGDKGDNGDTGAQGLPGVKGDKGDNGDAGAQGLPGVKGDKGDNGDTGAQGLPGAQGDKGDNGDTGAQGLPGVKGDNGENGDTGAQGLPGAQGDKGDNGDTGAQGLPGVKGDTGDNGVGIEWLGTLTTVPDSPSLNQAFYNIAEGVSCLFDGDSWEILSRDAGSTVTECQTSSGTFVDSRDSKQYNWVRIGLQKWMAENLNYATTGGSYCYDDDSANCDVYGRLYDWNTVMDGAAPSNTNPSGVQGVCPEGWHVPSRTEVTQLVFHAYNNGAENNPGTSFKSESMWNGTDLFGFNGLPGGVRRDFGDYQSIDTQAQWWTTYMTDPVNGTKAYTYTVSSGSNGVGEGPSKFLSGHSMRCLSDNP